MKQPLILLTLKSVHYELPECYELPSSIIYFSSQDTETPFTISTLNKLRCI